MNWSLREVNYGAIPWAMGDQCDHWMGPSQVPRSHRRRAWRGDFGRVFSRHCLGPPGVGACGVSTAESTKLQSRVFGWIWGVSDTVFVCLCLFWWPKHIWFPLLWYLLSFSASSTNIISQHCFSWQIIAHVGNPIHRLQIGSSRSVIFLPSLSADSLVEMNRFGLFRKVLGFKRSVSRFGFVDPRPMDGRKKYPYW